MSFLWYSMGWASSGAISTASLIFQIRAKTATALQPRPGFRRKTATKADSFAGVNRYSRQIARISLLAIPAGLLALGCGPYLMRQR